MVKLYKMISLCLLFAILNVYVSTTDSYVIAPSVWLQKTALSPQSRWMIHQHPAQHTSIDANTISGVPDKESSPKVISFVRDVMRPHALQLHTREQVPKHGQQPPAAMPPVSIYMKWCASYSYQLYLKYIHIYRQKNGQQRWMATTSFFWTLSWYSTRLRALCLRQMTMRVCAAPEWSEERYRITHRLLFHLIYMRC